MSNFQTPIGKTRLLVPQLGTVEGYDFSNGVRQFCGIRYATIVKRWTRSRLNTEWPGRFHDGTRLGSSAPNPPEYNTPWVTIPLEPTPHYGVPDEEELSCLVMNITTPDVPSGTQFPVMVYIHGGSFLFGGASASIYDHVNFVSFSQTRGTPVIAVNFNYRVGLGGFLASHAIKDELQKDGHTGCGNFGLFDQQLALKWINLYISAFGGDPGQVTIYGESAGGMSVAHQITAQDPAPFQRAVAMSGQLNTIPTWSIHRHEQHYRALLKCLNIDPDAVDSLERLRRVPQAAVAAATLQVEGVFVATGNPCDDGVFHGSTPTFDKISSPPPFLKSYMVGDVLDEGMIFSMSLAEESVESVANTFSTMLGPEVSAKILDLYGIVQGMPEAQFNKLMMEMAGDAIFRSHNWIAAQRSEIAQTFSYHFDQPSTLDNELKGLAYHALDLLYLFLNFDHRFTPAQQRLARQMAGHFVDLAYGLDPWPRVHEASQWMRYGPGDECSIVTETEDEPVRKYSRTQNIMDMGVYEAFVAAVDHIVVKRSRMGTFEWSPPVIPNDDHPE